MEYGEYVNKFKGIDPDPDPDPDCGNLYMLNIS